MQTLISLRDRFGFVFLHLMDHRIMTTWTTRFDLESGPKFQHGQTLVIPYSFSAVSVYYIHPCYILYTVHCYWHSAKLFVCLLF